MARGTLFCALTALSALLPVAACTSNSAEAQDVSAIWDITAEPNPRLGLAFPGSATEYYPFIADAGIGTVRLSASWALLEPQEGEMSFAGLDGRILALDALGIEAFLTFESNADWATESRQPVKNAQPRELTQWASFVRQVVERYDMDGVDDLPGLTKPVKLFQVANEFSSPTNRSGGWAGTPEELVDYVNIAHDAVKGANPNATFVLGGIAAYNIDILLLDAGLADFTLQQKWSETSMTVFDPADLNDPDLREWIDVGFKTILNNAKYDWSSVHLYGPENRDTFRLEYMQDLTQTTVISSECGGPSLDYGGVYTGQAHFGAVLERNLNTLAAGAPFCLWFGLGEAITSTFGNAKVQLYDTQEREKPGVAAYRILSRLLTPDAAVTKPSDGLFIIESARGRVCVAVGADQQGLVKNYCNSDAICIHDAAKRDASLINAALLPQNCNLGGISITGGGALSAITDRN